MQALERGRRRDRPVGEGEGQGFGDGCLANALATDKHGGVRGALAEHVLELAELALAPDKQLRLSATSWSVEVGEHTPDIEGLLARGR